MDLMKYLTMTDDDKLQIIVTKDFEIDSYIKGYHVYKRSWVPQTGGTYNN